MINITYEFVAGILVSFINIYGLNYFYSINSDLRYEIGSYRKIIIYIPLYYAFVTIIVAKFLDSMLKPNTKVRNYFAYIKGFIIGLVLAIIDKYLFNIDDLLNINGNMIFLYYAIIYTIIYGFIIENIKYNICY